MVSATQSDYLYDGTTDGTHNYALGTLGAKVYSFDSNWGNFNTMFTLPVIPGGGLWLGITQDPSNNSLWVSTHNGGNGNYIANYTMGGTLISSFSVVDPGGNYNIAAGLALDPADQTLWLVREATLSSFAVRIDQYSKQGVFLGSITAPELQNFDSTGAEFPAGAGSPSDTQGPITSNSMATPKLVPMGTGFILTANLTDATTGGSTIASAEYSIDGGPYLLMNAVDGLFNQATENGTANVAPPIVAGVYNICIRGTDSQNNVGAPECFIVPVYDPSAGFVTGGGWIISRARAYLADANLTGKANFGFVSKYVKGKSIPTGETEFQFQVASFKFNSTVYEWLVVTGAKAQYQGRGTVNGSGVYQFVLTAKDGELAVPVEQDKFRIKITDIDASSPNYGKVVYDNQRGQSTDLNTAEPQAISGGSIVVHKTK